MAAPAPVPTPAPTPAVEAAPAPAAAVVAASGAAVATGPQAVKPATGEVPRAATTTARKPVATPGPDPQCRDLLAQVSLGQDSSYLREQLTRHKCY